MFFSTFQMIGEKVLLNCIACISFPHFQTLFINQFAPNQLKIKHFLWEKKKEKQTYSNNNNNNKAIYYWERSERPLLFFRVRKNSRCYQKFKTKDTEKYTCYKQQECSSFHSLPQLLPTAHTSLLRHTFCLNSYISVPSELWIPSWFLLL